MEIKVPAGTSFPDFHQKKNQQPKNNNNKKKKRWIERYLFRKSPSAQPQLTVTD